MHILSYRFFHNNFLSQFDTVDLLLMQSRLDSEVGTGRRWRPRVPTASLSLSVVALGMLGSLVTLVPAGITLNAWPPG